MGREAFLRLFGALRKISIGKLLLEIFHRRCSLAAAHLIDRGGMCGLSKPVLVVGARLAVPVSCASDLLWVKNRSLKKCNR